MTESIESICDRLDALLDKGAYYAWDALNVQLMEAVERLCFADKEVPSRPCVIVTPAVGVPPSHRV